MESARLWQLLRTKAPLNLVTSQRYDLIRDLLAPDLTSSECIVHDWNTLGNVMYALVILFVIRVFIFFCSELTSSLCLQRFIFRVTFRLDFMLLICLLV